MVRTFAIALIVASAGTTNAQVVWDEDINGNLSGDPTAPTNLGTFGAGALIVRGSTLGSATPPSDGYDVFQFNIDPGFEITSIILSAYTTDTGGAGTSGFNFSTVAAAGNGGNVLFGPGWGAPNVGGDLFDEGLLGPITSLGDDTYFMEVREFGGPQANWELTFNVVPAPASAALLGLGGLAAARRRR